MTFGEFLGYILTKKNISVAKLANLTNTKSRTTIQRLLKDESSMNVIQNFIKTLVKLNTLNLSPLEHNQLKESIEVTKIGKNSLLARKTLLSFFQKYQVVSKLTSTHVYGSQMNKQISLHQLFLSYANYSSVKILIINAVSLELKDSLISFIQNLTSNEVSIDQIIYFGNDANENATTFLSICNLLNYTNYNAYHNVYPEIINLSKNNISAMSDLIIVLKILDDGSSITDLIKFDSNMNFKLLSDNPGDSLYNFYLDAFEEIKNNYQPIRKAYESNDIIDKLIELCEYLFSLEKSTEEYLIKQNMCIQMIHVDILYKMLVDSDFLGLSEDHPKIKNLVRVIQDRFTNYYHIEKMKFNLFTKRGLLDFVKTGTLTDHFFCFRPFTKEEIKYTLEYLLKQLEDNIFFKMYLLKDDYLIGNIEYVYYEGVGLYLFDSSSGYCPYFDEAMITAKPIIDIFDDFIKNELIKNHTFPESETISFLKDLISTIM